MQCPWQTLCTFFSRTPNSPNGFVMKISTRSSSPNWELLGSNRQAAGRSIFVWLGLLATFLIPSHAKLLSHKQKCSLSLHVHWFGCAQILWSGFSKKVPQEHLAASTLMPVVQFTCCERLSKLPADSLLQDRSSCQFGELFRKHKLGFTGPVWIAGDVAPLNKCRIANSSKLQ